MGRPPETLRAAAGQPEAELIRAQLKRILAHPLFAQADRLSRFLAYVVDHALLDPAAPLKETMIGTDIYGRLAGYDPKADPIVRTEARRLRAKLQQYYESAGRNDPVWIAIPKGGYSPKFEVHPQAVAGQSPAVRRRLKMLILISGAIIVCAAVSFFVFLPARKPSSGPTLAPLTSYPGYELDPSISPDGKQLAFVWNKDPNNYDIYLKVIGTDAAVRLTRDSSHDLHPAWSPDGRSLAFIRVSPENMEIFVMPALGGSERRLTRVNPGMTVWQSEALDLDRSPGPVWSADGKFLVAADREAGQGPDKLYAISLETGDRLLLTSPEPESQGDAMPALSPGGRNLAFIRAESKRGITDIYVMPIGGGAPKRITSDRKTIYGLAWESDDALLFSSNRSGGRMLWRVGVRGGTPELIAIAGRRVFQLSSSGHGRCVAYTESFLNTNIWRTAIVPVSSDAKAQSFIGSSGMNDSPKYSPDGARIVFGSDRSGIYEIWTCNADGSNPTQLTSFGGLPVGSPRWSPDGRQIVFDAVLDGRSVIYVINADGGKPRLIASESTDDMMPTWSADGRFIYFASARQPGELQIFRKPVAGGPAVQVVAKGGGEALESGDGGILYFSDGSNGIWQMAGSGGEARRVQDLETARNSRHWAVTRRGIYTLLDNRPPWTVYFYDPLTHRSLPVAVIQKPLYFGTPSLAVSPDDRWLLYAQVDNRGSDIMMLSRGSQDCEPRR